MEGAAGFLAAFLNLGKWQQGIQNQIKKREKISSIYAHPCKESWGLHAQAPPPPSNPVQTAGGGPTRIHNAYSDVITLYVRLKFLNAIVIL